MRDEVKDIAESLERRVGALNDRLNRSISAGTQKADHNAGVGEVGGGDEARGEKARENTSRLSSCLNSGPTTDKDWNELVKIANGYRITEWKLDKSLTFGQARTGFKLWGRRLFDDFAKMLDRI